jgi:hypothetical protein
MLTDKQSLILCAIVALGFSACGIIGILDNYAIIGVLSAGFLIILINMFMVLKNQDSEDSQNEINEEIDITDK